MNSFFTRWLPCATLATWSAILVGFFLTGRVRDFLAPEFRPGVLVAGLVMGAMALIFLIFPADASCCSSAGCGHSLSRLASGKVLTFLILLLPITTAAMFSPDSFSGTAMKNRGVITDASALGGRGRTGPMTAEELPLPSNQPEPPLPTASANSSPAPAPPSQQQATAPAPQDYLQRTADGTIVVEVLDLLYAAQDNALRKDFEGKKVELVGQLMPETADNANGHRFKAVRMFMTCCAADARPVATLVEAPGKVKLPEMAWIKITGTATFPIENGRRIAVLKSDKVEGTKPPDESMLY